MQIDNSAVLFACALRSACRASAWLLPRSYVSSVESGVMLLNICALPGDTVQQGLVMQRPWSGIQRKHVNYIVETRDGNATLLRFHFRDPRLLQGLI
jgi:hypothetical protein